MIKDLMIKLEKNTKTTENENYIISKLSDDLVNGDMRGWLCGHFYPKDSKFHRNDIEICFKILPKGFSEDLHHHLCSFEFLILLAGEVEYEIDGNYHTLTPGMFYMLEPGNTERIVNIKKDITVLAVRLPSVPGNKIFE